MYSRTKFKFPSAVTFYPPVTMTSAERRSVTLFQNSGSQMRTSGSWGHQLITSVQEDVGNWNFLPLLPQRTSRNVEKQSVPHPKIRLFIDRDFIYHWTHGLLLHLKPADYLELQKTSALIVKGSFLEEPIWRARSGCTRSSLPSDNNAGCLPGAAGV